MAEDQQHHATPEKQKRGVERPTPSPRDERSVGDLFKELARETQMLLRQEFQLAKTEATEKASKASKGVGFVAAGGFVAYAGFLALVAALGFLLGSFMANWLGFLAAGLLVLIAGYALFQKGLSSLKSTDFSFDHTAESLQEDKLWMKQEAQEIKRDPTHLGAER